MLPQHERLLGPLLDTVSDLVVLVDPDGRIAMFNRACEELTGYRREEVLGSGLVERLVPAHCADEVKRWLAEPLDPQAREPHENPWVTRSGEERIIRWSFTALREPVSPRSYVLGVGTDVTDQRRIRQQLLIQSRLTEGFFESTLTGAALLDRGFNYLRVNGAYAEACRRDAGDFVGRNIFELYPGGAKDIFAEVARTKQPYQVRGYPYTFPNEPGRGMTYWDWSLVPVLDEHDEVEVLVLCLNEVTEFQQQLNLSRALSHQIAEAQERERWRIGLDLHDEIGQGLTAVKLALNNAIGSGSPLSGHRLSGALETVDGLIETVRKIALELRPPMLDDLGLLPALLWLVDRHRSVGGLHADFKHSGLDKRLPCAIETGAYRIIQEALTNVARYAMVSEAEVLVRATPDMLFLKVEDHGIGFEAHGALEEGKGSGLLGMRERARMLGGRLTVESAPKAGTAITAELPLEHRGD